MLHEKKLQIAPWNGANVPICKQPPLYLGVLLAGTGPWCGLEKANEEPWIKVIARAFIHPLLPIC